MAVVIVGKTTKLPVSLVTIWAKRLGLDNWRIELGEEDKDLDTETQAATAAQIPYREALITTGPNYPQDSEEEERVVVHELCHILTAPMNRAAENILLGYSNKQRAALEAVLTDAEEAVVTTLAELLIERLGSGWNEVK